MSHYYDADSQFDSSASLLSSEWSDEETLDLIGLYRQHFCLWNKDCADYLDYSAKRAAYEAISERLSSAMGVGVVEVMMKIREVRRIYVRELRRMIDSESTGKEFVSPGEWFNAIDDFLQEHLDLDEIEFVESALQNVGTREQNSRLDPRNENSSVLSDPASSRLSSSSELRNARTEKNWTCRYGVVAGRTRSAKVCSSDGWAFPGVTRRTKSDPERCAGGGGRCDVCDDDDDGSWRENTESLVSNPSWRSCATVRKSSDHFDTFAKSVACRLRGLKPQLAAAAQSEIHRTLQSFELGDSKLDGDPSKSWANNSSAAIDDACRKINEQSSEVITILAAAASYCSTR